MPARRIGRKGIGRGRGKREGERRQDMARREGRMGWEEGNGRAIKEEDTEGRETEMGAEDELDSKRGRDEEPKRNERGLGRWRVAKGRGGSGSRAHEEGGEQGRRTGRAKRTRRKATT